MKCTYCGKEVEQNKYVKIERNYFCDNLCKYSFYKRGKVNKKDINPNTQPLPENLIFQIDYPNFKLNKLIVRGSFYGKPKLFLNGKKVKPTNRNIFSRKRKYKIKNDNGTVITAILIYRWMDAIPILEIDGIKIEIRKSLKWYEYIWIAIPLILMFIGGAIGGFIGAVGILTNSVLFRKFTSQFAKYLVTGVNSFIAFLFFFKVLFFIMPGIEELKFHYGQYGEIEASQMTVEQERKFNVLTSTPWILTEASDMSGKVSDLSNSLTRDSRKYFYKNGSFSQFLVDDSYVVGSWKFSKNYEGIILQFSDGIVPVQIVKLDNDEFSYAYNNVEIVKHVPYKFNFFGL